MGKVGGAIDGVDDPGIAVFAGLVFGFFIDKVARLEERANDWQFFDAWQLVNRLTRACLDETGEHLEALLDYIMISPDLMSRRPAWRIWHPFNYEECRQSATLQTALLAASDHFPVTLDIDI